MRHINTIIALATFALAAAACDPASIPNRNVNDVTHEVRTLNDTIRHLAVDNPNNVRVGSEFRVRIFRQGQREPLDTSVQHVYVPPNMEAIQTIDVTRWCSPPEGSDAPPEGSATEEAQGCDQIRVHAVLLSTYWMADE